MTSAQKSLWASILLIGIGLLAGCDATLTPFDKESGLYSVYGYLTLNDGPHYLRVKELSGPVNSDSISTFNATITLTNVTTGQTETLTDSMVGFDQVTTHNFRTDQDIQPGATYRLQIERPNGTATAATATMPRNTEVEVNPSPSDSITCLEGVSLRFQDIRGESRVEISAGVVWEDSLRWVHNDLETLTGDSVETAGGFLSWRIVKSVVPNFILTGLKPREYCKVLDEKKVYVAYTHFGPDWPADSVLGNPAQSTVKNGLGVFGGLRRDTLKRFLKPVE